MKKLITILGIVLSCSLAFGQVPWKKFIYFSNSGGLNDNLSVTEIQDSECTDIQNVIFDTGGALKKRFGFDNVPNSPVTSTPALGTLNCIIGLQYFKKDNGDEYLFAINNQDGQPVAYANKYSSGDPIKWGSADSGVTDDNGSNYSNNDLTDFALASDTLVFALGDGSKKPLKWTSSSAVVEVLTADTDTASCSLVEYHKNHLFTNDAASGSLVRFSVLDNIKDWEPLDFFLVEAQDGSKVRALISAFDSLYIFKDYSIWRLSGYERDSFRLEKMVDGVGTLSQPSVAVVGNLIYFVTSQNDICVYNGAYSVAYPSHKIRTTVTNSARTRSENTLGIAYSSYRNTDHDYYVSMSNFGSSTNDRVLLFDTLHKAWTKLTGINANAWTVGEDSDDKDVLYFGDYNGYIYSYPSSNYYDGNISTNAITAFYQTKWFKYSDVALGDKYWRLLRTWALSEEDALLTAECKADYEATGTQYTLSLDTSEAEWDSSIWDIDLWGGQSVIIGRTEVEKGRNMFQIKYHLPTSTSSGCTILGWEIFVEPTDRI